MNFGRLSDLGNPDSRQFDWPESGRLAGIDFGTVRVGVAICDPSRTWTSPLETYTRRNIALDQEHFEELVRENQILGWVVGLPIHCDGRESRKSEEARDFASWLYHVTEKPVRFIDERYTTALANRLLRDAELTNKKRKKRVDKIAAHLILETYLESAKHPSFQPLPLED
ncbi:MAG TPA: Holliday junction resolvase RuvX [Pirellula sp.]|nr:Holliday junction resolvase RuvX [Pirellula sp.]